MHLKYKGDPQWAHLQFSDFHNVQFTSIYHDLVSRGEETSPRCQKVLEIENYSYNLYPYTRFTSFDERNFNLDYVKKEFMWYLKGDRFDTSITEHGSMWKNLIAEDGGINSNYGQYIFGTQQQFWNVVDQLVQDKDSRRASIVILAEEHLKDYQVDLPCTYSINFRIRDNKLNMSVNMRSQDAIFGMTNDAPTFSFIHEMMYITLKDEYPDLEYGMYNHKADSFHVYERHFDMIDSLAQGYNNDGINNYNLVLCPKMRSSKEVRFLMNMHDVDPGEFDLRDVNVPEEYEFTKWLLHEDE